MFNRRCCKNRRCSGQNKTGGVILISIGVGLFLAYIIPYYLLITLLGMSLICVGVSCMLKK